MKRTALRYLVAYLAGIGTVIALGIHAGGETVTQIGLRLAAAETQYDWSAAPRMTVAEAAPIPQRKGKARR